MIAHSPAEGNEFRVGSAFTYANATSPTTAPDFISPFSKDTLTVSTMLEFKPGSCISGCLIKALPPKERCDRIDCVSDTDAPLCSVLKVANAAALCAPCDIPGLDSPGLGGI